MRIVRGDISALGHTGMRSALAEAFADALDTDATRVPSERDLTNSLGNGVI